MDTDHNLLFGVISMQAGLIDAGQFVEACGQWATQKSDTLAELLIGRGWITGDDRSHIEYLLNRRLEKHNGDVQASLASVPEAVRRSLSRLGDAEIQQSLTCRPDDDSFETTHVFLAEPQEVIPSKRYELAELHASGGTGRVWLAADMALSRTVALKELKPELAGDNTSLARFYREARITGQLNIQALSQSTTL